MADVLYAWPAAAAFGRRVPKEKLYAHGSVTTAVRERFVDEVASVEWAYKLAESTVNVPGDDEVPELQVFRVTAKGEDVSTAVLAAIDNAVAFPLVFEIARSDAETRMTAAMQKSGTYHSTGWMPSGHERAPLPTAITLSALYAAILEPLLPVAGRAAESPAELAGRLKRIDQLERQVAAAERRLRNEPQLNRKLEIRRALTALRSELEAQR
ncbi:MULTISPECIES: DUF4391 domain-containing protein [Microbacterium]|uniref:DUF4391 domain-containing protein n=1 Tax=Microbacterium TaxID=33882 RepID=UPI00217D8455|nr:MULTISPECIES: DUF4391 domain-containing protein [Microbacterium]UWF77609.1 DUF4391 domain-containing protein [Microbacterium neungamense]WCM55780.1 DUF4391 domain-containing protein [Microbacterium sp. EF45047]